ncbi:MAG TPA: ABC transporter permease subunit [Arenicellales bacterium]|nr:ABC transporter permease subunit [Arenicellales bacterium]
MSAPAQTTGRGSAPVRGLSGLAGDRLLLAVIGVIAAVPLLVFFVYPLAVAFARSFVTLDGEVGLANYRAAFDNPSFWSVTWNSLEMSLVTTALSMIIGFALAYGVHRTRMPGKAVFSAVAMLPLLAPSLVQALGLIFLLGRNGIVNRTFDLGIEIYGFPGLVIANTLYAFPQVFLIISAAMAVSDARMDEAAEVLGAGRLTKFLTVTIPSVKFGLVSAAFLAFTLTITDFGNAMVIGADYSVLATEIYNQVVGQMNFNLGAVIGIVLLIPAAVAFLIQRAAARRQFAALTDQSVPFEPKRDRLVDAALFILCSLIALAIVAVVGIVVFASFVKLWPYDMSMTLNNYSIELKGGFAPVWTSIKVSVIAALLGVLLVVSLTYVTQRMDNRFTRAMYFLSILPAAVPGMVLGLAYIFAFNDPDSPVYFLYGTVALLALCHFYHYHSQGFLTATTSLKQISITFEESSKCLGAGFFHTLRHIVLPLMLPTVLAVAIFFFMRSMVSLSAAIFLVTPKVEVAAVTIMRLDETGLQGQAAAFATAVIAVVLAALGLFKLVMRVLGVRASGLTGAQR